MLKIQERFARQKAEHYHDLPLFCDTIVVTIDSRENHVATMKLQGWYKQWPVWLAGTSQAMENAETTKVYTDGFRKVNHKGLYWWF